MMKAALLSAILCVTALFVQAQRNVFVLDGHKVRSGEKMSFDIAVKAPGGDSTRIPVTVVNGRRPGPVLGLLAGIHGYEYPPIMALQQLAPTLDPAEISGTIVLIHIANVNAFLSRSVYYNPADGKNLNRQFPGKKDGTITECIAWTLSRNVFPKLQYLVDIHAGDANEDLHPYVGYVVSGKQTEMGKKMADAMGFDWVIRSERAISDTAPSIYASSEGIAQGIPTIAIECGKMGVAQAADIEMINNGLRNLMRTLLLLPGKPLPAKVSYEITQRQTISSEHTGIFYSDYKSGALVRKGMKLGVVTDFFGKVLQEVVAPADGFIIYKVSTPPINKGELLFNLGLLTL